MLRFARAASATARSTSRTVVSTGRKEELTYCERRRRLEIRITRILPLASYSTASTRLTYRQTDP
jgi:hypothetical protein